MKLYQIGLHCVSCIACLVCSFVSLNMPWVKIPIVLGLFSCFGNNCGKVPYFTHNNNVEENSLDVLSDMHIIDYETILKTAVGPFRMASIITIILTCISCVIISISLGMCFHQLYNTIYVDYERHAILFIGGLLFYYIAAVMYVALTVTSLNGGQYLEGLWLCGNTGMFGLVCSVVCLLMSKSRRPEYTPLMDSDFVDIDARNKSLLQLSGSSSYCRHEEEQHRKGEKPEQSENREGRAHLNDRDEFVSVERVPIAF